MHLSGFFDLFSSISKPSNGLKSEVLMDAEKLSFENCHVKSSASVCSLFIGVRFDVFCSDHKYFLFINNLKKHLFDYTCILLLLPQSFSYIQQKR